MESTLPEGMTENWARASRTVGGRIAWYRRQRDMQREDLAVMLRRSTSTVRRWEIGETSPTAVMLAKIATALRTPLVQLLPPDERAPLVQVDDAGRRQDDEGLQCSLLEQGA